MNHLTEEQIKNINQVIGWLESQREGEPVFDMGTWNGCGTVMCIGGYVQEHIAELQGTVAAGDALGIPIGEEDYAFMMGAGCDNQAKVTPSKAAQFLKNWRDHAILNWDRVL